MEYVSYSILRIKYIRKHFLSGRFKSISLHVIDTCNFSQVFRIDLNDEILRLIEESGLLIDDLTCGNKNFYHEVGYLMGKSR
jgi:hypothetical protein